VTPSSMVKLSKRNHLPIHAASYCRTMELVASTFAEGTLTLSCCMNGNVLLILWFVSEFDVCVCVCVRVCAWVLACTRALPAVSFVSQKTQTSVLTPLHHSIPIIAPS
jgi:hypothetical protein